MSLIEKEHMSAPVLELLAGIALLTFSAGNPIMIGAGLGLVTLGLSTGMKA